MIDKKELQKLLAGKVLFDDKTLDIFSEDTSLFKVLPELVVQPKSARDVEKLVAYVAKKKKEGENISLAPRSGGTCMAGGSLTESIVVDFAQFMNRFIGLNVKAKTATAQPGLYFRDFHQKTLAKKLLMPAYPASWQLCAIGGMVGNNAGGEKTFVYGKTENFIKKMKVVFADGVTRIVKPLSVADLKKKMAQKDFEGMVYKKMYALITKNEKILASAKPDVSKNSAGYYLWNVWDGKTFDLTKLLVGSQGTLGVVTEVTFDLVPTKKFSKLLVVFLSGLDDLGEMIVELKHHAPETIESYDDKTLKLAMRFAPDLIKLLKPKNILSMAWHLLPEFFMFLRRGLPKLVLMAEFTGDNEKEVLERMRSAKASFDSRFKSAQTRITSSDDERDQFWLIRRQSFALLRQKVIGRHTAPFIDDFAVRPEHLSEFLPKLNTILAKYKSLIFTIAGHPGDGNFHIIPLMKLKDPKQRAIIPKLSHEVYDLVLEYNGTITAEHNDGIVRTPFLEKMYGKKIIDLFEQTKDIFDPLGIFNPGKKVRAPKDYLESHIKADFKD